jgi:hypothetical protein
MKTPTRHYTAQTSEKVRICLECRLPECYGTDHQGCGLHADAYRRRMKAMDRKRAISKHERRVA